MKGSRFGIKVTLDDHSKKVIDDISLPVLRGSVQTQRALPNVHSATAALFFEFSGELFDIELTDEQIGQLNIQSFNKAEVRKDYTKKVERK